ncbi:MAG: ABC transporter permease [Acidimicrobiales bacterium]
MSDTTETHTDHDERDEYDDEAEPDVLGTSDTEAFTSDKRKELRRRRRDAKRAYRQSRSGASADDEIVFVYEPHVRFVPPIGPYLRDLWARREFAMAMAKSKVKGARSNTALGGLWALIDPLFMVALYYFLFTILRGGDRPSAFIPIIISGILHFQVSAAALNEGGNSVSSASGLMLNSTFPRMLLPLSAILGGVIKFLPSMPIIFGAAVLLDATIGVNLLWWFLLFPLQVVIGLGVALLVSTAIVFFKDIKNILSYVSRLMFFTSPIIFPIEIISDTIVAFIKWTPFFGIFANYQYILGGQRPDFGYLSISVGWAVGSVVLGGWLFLRYEREFATKL